MSDSWGKKEEEEEKRKRGVEAEEEGNKTSEMFPITGVGEDSSCAWIDLSSSSREDVVYTQSFLCLTLQSKKEKPRREQL